MNIKKRAIKPDVSFFFRNFDFVELTLHSEMKRKKIFSFAFLSFFSNFATSL